MFTMRGTKEAVQPSEMGMFLMQMVDDEKISKKKRENHVEVEEPHPSFGIVGDHAVVVVDVCKDPPGCRRCRAEAARHDYGMQVTEALSSSQS